MIETFEYLQHFQRPVEIFKEHVNTGLAGLTIRGLLNAYPTKCNINDINIEIFSQPTVAGRIKGWIFNGNNLTYDKKQITELDYFSDKEYYYIIVYDKPSLPIVNINIQKI